MQPNPPDAVAAWWSSVPPECSDRLRRLDRIIRGVADQVDAIPVAVELKWGQPSYRSPHGSESTPLRLDWTPDGDVALLAHCQSTVIGEFEAAYGDRFRFDGNRAVLFGPDDDLREDELAELVRHALTYRRRRRPSRAG